MPAASETADGPSSSNDLPAAEEAVVAAHPHAVPMVDDAPAPLTSDEARDLET